MDYTNKIDFSPGSLARTKIKNEFNHKKWEPFKEWLFKNFSKEELKIIQEIFYDYLSSVNKIIYFVPWFIRKYITNNINMIEREWLVNGQSSKGIFPPQQPFQITKEDICLKFKAYQKSHDNNTNTTDQINTLIQQTNYTNLYSIILGEQILNLNEKIDQIKKLLQDSLKVEEKAINKDKIISATIQPPPNITDYKLKDYTKLEQIIYDQVKALTSKMNQLSINVLKEDLENNDISENNIGYESEIDDQINKLDKYARKPVQRMYYYPRPTPQDVLHEEQEYILNNSYSGKNIYEWNLDGYTERQIYSMTHRMMMYSTIARNAGNDDKKIANMLIAGFTGQLKGWWDNYLSIQDQQIILNTVKTEDGVNVSKAVYTLMVNIIEHFTGRWSDNSENIRSLLNGLRCRTLTSFRWYKDTFLSRVMELRDCNSVYWKSKFIDGLPNLFADRVKKQLRNSNSTIPYEEYTYGKLIGTCIQEGLSLCNDIKLNHQIKTQHLNEKKQLGQFCDQFGIETPKSKGKHKKEFKSKKPFVKQKYKRKFSKKEIYNKKKPQASQNPPTCWKCGKVGHFANKCRMKKKINNLNIDEKMKSQLMSILLNTSSDDSDNSSSEEEINNSDEGSETGNEENCACIDKEQCSCQENNFEDELYLIQSQFQENMSINVLSSDVAHILKKIKDPQIRNQIIDDLKDKPESNIDEPYSMKHVHQMLKEKQGYTTEYNSQITIKDLNNEVKNLKQEISIIKNYYNQIDKRISKIEDKELKTNIIKDDDIPETSNNYTDDFLQSMELITSRKWYVKINLLIGYNYKKEFIALVDSGADLNCIQEGLIPTKYFQKTSHILREVSGRKLDIKYKLTNAKICQSGVCLPLNFTIIKNMTSNKMILGNPFLEMIIPFRVDEKNIIGDYQGNQITFEFIMNPYSRWVNEIQDQLTLKHNQINFIKEEILSMNINEQIKYPKIQDKIKLLTNQFTLSICNDHPNAFWERKKHIVPLIYEDDFNEKNIPTKARPCQMNHQYLDMCKKEISSLINKKLIQPSKSPWSCTAFYVNKHAEQERGVPRLVINYKPLNKVLKWIRYPIPNKKDLLDRLHDSLIFSKFDLKSGYWQIQIDEKDRYKTAFNVPFGQYEWNVMPFGLKNAPSEFQNIMNDIFNPYSDFIIVYIDDILIFSKTIETHFKHLYLFEKIIIKNGLVISQTKMSLFQTNIRFLGHNIEQGKIIPINRSIEFASKFPDKITDKTQLQRFLGSLNYISPFYKNLTQDTAILYDRLKKQPVPWTEEHTKIVQKIKEKVKTLPCLSLANPNWQKIVETDASDIGYGGILKQIHPESKQEYLVRFHSGKWIDSQKNYSTTAKEILALVKCILKFQEDLYNQHFIIKTDCQAAKFMFNKDFKHDVSKQMFSRWQANLACFDFEIQYKKGEDNSLPDFLTREYLQDDSL